VVEVDGVPQGDRVEDQAERAELVFHPVAVAVAQFALAAVEHRAREVGLPVATEQDRTLGRSVAAA
jgi:hypothetical protein